MIGLTLGDIPLSLSRVRKSALTSLSSPAARPLVPQYFPSGGNILEVLP
jgi:hypothetical protein